MSLPIIVSQSSNFLYSIQKRAKSGSVKYNIHRYLDDEQIDAVLCARDDQEFLKITKELIGVQRVKEFNISSVKLKHNFDIKWEEIHKSLSVWKKYLQNKESLLKKILVDIQKLGAVKKFNISKILICLVSDPTTKSKEINAWFSWAPNKSFIVVEIPAGLHPPVNLFPISILAHEYFHLMLRKNKLVFSDICEVANKNLKILKKAALGMPERLFLEELMLSSFIPEGYLSAKYLKIPISPVSGRPKKLLAWRKYIAYKLRHESKNYVDKSRRVGTAYLKQLVKTIEENIK